jgi:hypothetical protein
MTEKAVQPAQSGGSLIDVPQSKYDNTAMEAMSSSNKFLPRLQLMTSRSEQVEMHGFPANHFACIEGKNHLDLGESTDILLIAWRPKALDMSGEDIVQCLDPKFDDKNQPTGIFKEIQDRSFVKDSKCMFGPEYLCYIPSVKKYATFFCGGITLRNEAPAFSNRLGKAATLRPTKITPKKQKPYFSTKVYDCTTVFDIPEQADIKEVAETFLNPPAETVEGVSEAEAKSTGRAQ